MAAGRILPRSAWQRRSFAASDCANCIKWLLPLRTAVRRGNRDSRSCVFLLRGSSHVVRRSVCDTNTTATSAAPGVGHGTMLHRRPLRQPISQARSHRRQHPGRSSGTGAGSPEGLPRTRRRRQARPTASLVSPKKKKQISLSVIGLAPTSRRLRHLSIGSP